MKCSVLGCKKTKGSSKGLCDAHYQRIRKRGTTDLLPKPIIEERFYSKVEFKEGSDCHWWTGSISADGYAQFCDEKGKTCRSSRFIYDRKIKRPGKLFVLHKCDNPRCVNVDHLFLGTHKENMRDMSEKGRACRGQDQRLAKLKPEDVLEIRRLAKNGERNIDLAELFSVSTAQISAITTRRQWKHV